MYVPCSVSVATYMFRPLFRRLLLCLQDINEVIDAYTGGILMNGRWQGGVNFAAAAMLPINWHEDKWQLVPASVSGCTCAASARLEGRQAGSPSPEKIPLILVNAVTSPRTQAATLASNPHSPASGRRSSASSSH